MDFIINLNSEEELHSGIEEIRTARNRMKNEDINRIIVSWNETEQGEPKEHRIPFITRGSALWVIGYQALNGSDIFFEREREDGTLNYAKTDIGEQLTLDAVKRLLKFFEKIPPVTNFAKGNHNRDNRSAYVMAVFIVSEIVRNEVLELVLRCGSKDPAPFIMSWKDYQLLYKNWESTTRILYPEEKGDVCPVIRAKGLRSRISNLAAEEDMQTIKSAYEELMGLLTQSNLQGRS